MVDLHGVLAPMVTPFTDDASSVSEIRVARLVRHLSGKGASGLVLCTETGEFGTFGSGERKNLLELTLREARDLTVLVNVTSLSTMESLDLAQHAGRHGAQAAIAGPPYVGTYLESELYSYFRALAIHAGLPVLVVDPNRMIGESLRDRLKELRNLILVAPAHCAKSVSTADSFALADATCAFPAAIDPAVAMDCDSDTFRLLCTLGETQGSAKVAKAALQLLNLEMGPPRGPIQPLEGLPLERLRLALQ